MDRFRGCLLGLACGDAVGTTTEFQQRGSFQEITDMVGGGPYKLKPGQWTDDTSMALCLGDSLLSKGKFDAADQLKRYVMWADDGYFSSTDGCVDIGETTKKALEKFKALGSPYSGSADPETAGNGCIMRLAPVPMFFYPDMKDAVKYSGISSRTTHGAMECIECSKVLGGILYNALDGEYRDSVIGLVDIPRDLLEIRSEKVQAVIDCAYLGKKRHEIRSRGYVVDTLEAALWCFANTESFREAILTAANLGFDADTVAAVTGQIAGAFYGASAIPAGWLGKLYMIDVIDKMAIQLYEANRESGFKPF